MRINGRNYDANTLIAMQRQQETTRREGDDARRLSVQMADGDPTNPRHLAMAEDGVPSQYMHAPLSYLDWRIRTETAE